MNKKRIILPDGRYLIYYTFEPGTAGPPESGPPPSPSHAGSRNPAHPEESARASEAPPPAKKGGKAQ